MSEATVTTTTPWIEKYRPKSLSQVACQEETIAVLKKTLESKNLPHCLFYGPPGTGKTSTILALARELYGPEMIKSRVLELNASDERGISVIREKVKNFAKLAVSSVSNGAHPCPPFKIIILDEADSMTADAQSALRRTMETYSKVTRFCLICNYVSRIIEPLASRCAKFRFRSLDSDSLTQRLERVALAESVSCSQEALKALVTVAEGDLRKAIMYLQSLSRLYRSETVTLEAVTEMAGVVPQTQVQAILDAWMSKDAGKVEQGVTAFVREGYSATQLLSQLHDQIMAHPHISGLQKAKMARALGKTDASLTDGADEQLQMMALLVSAF